MSTSKRSPITRALTLFLALILALGVAVPAGAAGTGTGFSDVSAGDYFSQAVEWAIDQDITQGTGGGRFSPDNTVTRAEAVTFLWRAQGRPEPGSSVSPFADVTDKNAYYYDEIDGLVAGEDYNIWTKSGGSNTSTWTIVYY